MNKKLKLALAALLGFSAACSTVKNAPAKGGEEQQQQTGSPQVQDSVKVPPRIVVMYGVRPPGKSMPGTGVHIPDAKVQSADPEELDPVAETPAEDTPAMDAAKGGKASGAEKPAGK